MLKLFCMVIALMQTIVTGWIFPTPSSTLDPGGWDAYVYQIKQRCPYFLDNGECDICGYLTTGFTVQEATFDNWVENTGSSVETWVNPITAAEITEKGCPSIYHDYFWAPSLSNARGDLFESDEYMYCYYDPNKERCVGSSYMQDVSFDMDNGNTYVLLASRGSGGCPSGYVDIESEAHCQSAITGYLETYNTSLVSERCGGKISETLTVPFDNDKCAQTDRIFETSMANECSADADGCGCYMTRRLRDFYGIYFPNDYASLNDRKICYKTECTDTTGKNASEEPTCSCGLSNEICNTGQFCVENTENNCRDVRACESLDSTAVNIDSCSCDESTCEANQFCEQTRAKPFYKECSYHPVCTNVMGLDPNDMACKCGPEDCSNGQYCVLKEYTYYTRNDLEYYDQWGNPSTIDFLGEDEEKYCFDSEREYSILRHISGQPMQIAPSYNTDIDIATFVQSLNGAQLVYAKDIHGNLYYPEYEIYDMNRIAKGEGFVIVANTRLTIRHSHIPRQARMREQHISSKNISKRHSIVGYFGRNMDTEQYFEDSDYRHVSNYSNGFYEFYKEDSPKGYWENNKLLVMDAFQIYNPNFDPLVVASPFGRTFYETAYNMIAILPLSQDDYTGNCGEIVSVTSIYWSTDVEPPTTTFSMLQASGVSKANLTYMTIFGSDNTQENKNGMDHLEPLLFIANSTSGNICASVGISATFVNNTKRIFGTIHFEKIVDTDDDGMYNFHDTDDDNDGVADTEDALPLNPSEWSDTDNDGVGNNADTDDDNDGVADTEDAFPLNPSEWSDTDNDGVGNNADTDDDNDGVADTEDAFPLNPSEWSDADNDGVGNNADTDDDNDGVADTEDAFPFNPSEWSDTDNDGVGNNADTDDDNDGVADTEDKFPFDASRLFCRPCDAAQQIFNNMSSPALGPGGNCAPVACPIGHGFHQNTSQNISDNILADGHCVECALGQSFSDNPYDGQCQMISKVCEQGTRISDDITRDRICIDCDPGTFSSALNSPVCSSAEKGYFVANTKSTSQSMCLPGYYQNETGQHNCLECEVGTWSDEHGTIHCKSAAQGHFVQFKGQNSQVQCSEGRYQDELARPSCKECPLGWYQGEPGKITCVETDTGHRSEFGDRFGPGSTKQVPCSVGKYQNQKGKSICYACSRGYYQDENASIGCKAADLGYYVDSDESSEQTACAPGTYQQLFSDEPAAVEQLCFDCPQGWFWPGPEGTGSCIVSPAGYYTNSGLGQTEHFICPSGQYSVSEGSTQCSLCQSGKYSNTNEEGLTTDSHCMNCPRGKQTIGYSFGIDSCTNCPVGTENYYEGGPCTNCLPGRYEDEVGSVGCKTCALGTYTQGIGGQTGCSQCPVGTFGELVDDSGVCSACVRGKFNDETGTTACKPCPGGTYSNQTGQNICHECPRGHYCPPLSEGMGLNEEPYTCPIGEYQDEMGQSDCKDAGAGYYVDTNSAISQTPCEPGTASHETGRQTSCPLCSIGQYNDETAQNVCKECPTGTNSYEEGSVECEGCPTGKFNNGGAECFDCSDGYYQDQTGQNSCKPSDIGHLADRVNRDRQIPCAPGTYMDSVGYRYSETCHQCNPGRYQNEAGQSDCKQADVDHYVRYAGASDQISCLLVTENWNLPDDPSFDSDRTFPAGAGEQPNAGSDHCVKGTLCEQGMQKVNGQCKCQDGYDPCVLHEDWSMTCNSASVGPCYPCSNGWYSNSQTHGYCTQTQVGYYANAELGATEQLLCPEGTYQDEIVQSTCKDCPEGSTSKESRDGCLVGSCTKGSYKQGDECKLTDQGFYVPEDGATEQIPCPVGSIALLVESIDNWDSGDAFPQGGPARRISCIECPSGRYSNQVWEACNFCPHGHETQNNNNQVVTKAATRCPKCGKGLYDDDLNPSTACVTCGPGNEARRNRAAEEPGNPDHCWPNKWQNHRCAMNGGDWEWIPDDIAHIDTEEGCDEVTGPGGAWYGSQPPVEWLLGGCPDRPEKGLTPDKDQASCLEDKCRVIDEGARYCEPCPDGTDDDDSDSTTPCVSLDTAPAPTTSAPTTSPAPAPTQQNEAPQITFDTLNDQDTVSANYDNPYSPTVTCTEQNNNDLVVQTDGVVNSLVQGEYQITYTCTGTNELTTTRTRTVQVTENVPGPQIILNGEHHVYAKYDNPFIDSGATCEDYQDNVIEVVVNGTESVDIYTQGHYQITYTCTDANAKMSTITRTVQVTENVPGPQIAFAAHDDLDTVSAKYDTPYEPTVTCTDYLGQTLPLQIQGTVDIFTQGNYNLTYTCTDTRHQSATRQRTVQVDENEPEPYLITIGGNVTVSYLETYHEHGATCTDYQGNIRPFEVSEHTIDYNQIGTYEVQYTCRGQSGRSVTTTRYVFVDNIPAQPEPPEIILNGEQHLYVSWNNAYSEQGATCTDDQGNAIRVNTTGQVISYTEGRYEITYSCTDSEQRIVTSIRTVLVNESAPAPTVALNGDSPSIASYANPYNETGATCSDFNGQALNVAISGTVNSFAKGSYEITYSCTDFRQVTGSINRVVTVQQNVPWPQIAFAAHDDLDTVSAKYDNPYEPTVTCTDYLGQTLPLQIQGTVDIFTQGNYQFVYTCTDNLNRTRVRARTVQVTETPPKPTITYNQLDYTDSVTTRHDDIFEDYGAECKDYRNKNITLVVEGSVDPYIRGTYILTYRCTDLRSQTSTRTRIVTVPEDAPITDYCASYPCRTGARCVNGDDTFVCYCNTGWHGTTCNLESAIFKRHLFLEELSEPLTTIVQDDTKKTDFIQHSLDILRQDSANTIRDPTWSQEKTRRAIRTEERLHRENVIALVFTSEPQSTIRKKVIMPVTLKKQMNGPVEQTLGLFANTEIQSRKEQGIRMEQKARQIALKRQRKNAETFTQIEIKEEIHESNSDIEENCAQHGHCCSHDLRNDTIANDTLQMTSVSTYGVDSWIVICDHGLPVVKQTISALVNDGSDRDGEYKYTMHCWNKRNNQWDTVQGLKYADEDIVCESHTVFVGSATVINEECVIELGEHMSYGNCQETLSNGFSCTPECEMNYVPSDYTCSNGELTDGECIPPSHTESGPFAISGFYPLFNTSAAAKNAGDGTTHTHVFGGTTYYMPNDVTSYHGGYPAQCDATAGEVMFENACVTCTQLKEDYDSGCQCADSSEQCMAMKHAYKQSCSCTTRR